MMPLLFVIGQWVFLIDTACIVLETHNMMNIPIVARRRLRKYRDRQDRLRLDGSSVLSEDVGVPARRHERAGYPTRSSTLTFGSSITSKSLYGSKCRLDTELLWEGRKEVIMSLKAKRWNEENKKENGV